MDILAIDYSKRLKPLNKLPGVVASIAGKETIEWQI